MSISRTIAPLCERFPDCFVMPQHLRRPLKLGVHNDIIAILGDQIDPTLLKVSFRIYVSALGYLQAQRQGVSRIDLDGNAAGTVSEEHALGAMQAIAGIRAAQSKQRKPEITPPPEPPPLPQPPKRDGLGALREAAKRRKAVP